MENKKPLYGVIGLLAVVVVAGIAFLAWPDDEEEGFQSLSEQEGWEDEPPFDPFPDLDEPDPAPEDEEASAQGPRSRWGRGFDPERWRNMSEEDRARMRQRWQERRERWQNASPEQRRQWARRRVTITARGGGAAPTLEPEQVMESMRAARPQIRDCVQENGGFRALRQAMLDADAGPRGRGRGFGLTFDVGPDGQILTDSLAMSPPPAEPFLSCFTRAFTSIEIPSPGPDGAHVEMQMGPSRRGGRRSSGQGSSGQGSEATRAP